MQSAAPVKLLDRCHEFVVLTTFFLEPARKFNPDGIYGPSLEVCVDVIGRTLKLALENISLHAQHAIAHHSGFCNHHRQHLACSETRKVHVLKFILVAGAGRESYANSARDQREHVRRALQKLLWIANAAEGTGNHLLVGLRDLRASRELLDVVAVTLS